MTKIPAAAPVGRLKRRPQRTRWLVIALLPFVVTVAPPNRPVWVGELMEALGVFCLVVCLVGRGWTALYIAGRKNRELVTVGPYSVVRNPLYVFSFIGLIGIGLISEMMTLLMASIICFAAYYRVVVPREEAYLARAHDAAFTQYAASVPRWIPNFARWRDVRRVEVEPRLIFAKLRDSSLFFLSFMFFELMEFLRTIDAVPILARLP